MVKECLQRRGNICISLKREMRLVVLNECGLDPLTAATAFAYFEMLVVRNSVNKVNRKFCAGACIILAAKLNDVKGPALKNLIEVNTHHVVRKLLLHFSIGRKSRACSACTAAICSPPSSPSWSPSSSASTCPRGRSTRTTRGFSTKCEEQCRPHIYIKRIFLNGQLCNRQ